MKEKPWTAIALLLGLVAAVLLAVAAIAMLVHDTGVFFDLWQARPQSAFEWESHGPALRAITTDLACVVIGLLGFAWANASSDNEAKRLGS